MNRRFALKGIGVSIALPMLQCMRPLRATEKIKQPKRSGRNRSALRICDTGLRGRIHTRKRQCRALSMVSSKEHDKRTISRLSNQMGPFHTFAPRQDAYSMGHFGS